jgi:hypothetical protein
LESDVSAAIDGLHAQGQQTNESISELEIALRSRSRTVRDGTRGTTQYGAGRYARRHIPSCTVRSRPPRTGVHRTLAPRGGNIWREQACFPRGCMHCGGLWRRQRVQLGPSAHDGQRRRVAALEYQQGRRKNKNGSKRASQNSARVYLNAHVTRARTYFNAH